MLVVKSVMIPPFDPDFLLLYLWGPSSAAGCKNHHMNFKQFDLILTVLQSWPKFLVFCFLGVLVDLFVMTKDNRRNRGYICRQIGLNDKFWLFVQNILTQMSHFRKQASQMMMVIMMMMIASSSHFWLKQTKKNDLGPKTSAQTHPSQYHSNRSACFLQSQTPSPPYCRGGDPPPTSRRRRSERRNEAGWPWSYREADGTTIISTPYNNNSIGQICLCQLSPPFRGQSVHWWAAGSLPPGWRRRGLHGCGISGYGWCSRSWSRKAACTNTFNTVQCNEDEVRILTTKQRRWPEWWRGRRWRWSSQHNQWLSVPPGGR